MLGNLSLERPMRKENIFNISMGWGHSSDYRLTDVLAEDEGFEPSIGCPIHAFQACALGRYANPPEGSTLSVAITMITPDPSYGVIRTELPQGRNAARVGPLWRVCEGAYLIAASNSRGEQAMSLALYRKYRPSVFADVIGEEHVTVPL